MSIKIKTAEDDADLACLGCQEAAADEEGAYYAEFSRIQAA